jgi:tetratricopeptide (TPR) repeat protein
MKKFYRAMVLTVLGIVCSVPSFAANPRHYIDYYIEWYGSIDPSEDSKVAKTHQIFERVKKVANKHWRYLNPKLVVLKNKGNNPWAKALRDGNIVLWKTAIEASYQKTRSMDEIEARLAFILGHELGHLARDDYWYLDINCKLSGRRCFRQNQERMKIELAADREGYAYAAMAGYRVNLLLGNASQSKAFLTPWLKQHVKLPKSSLYPSIQKRIEILWESLQAIQNKLTFFDFGVRLSHFDRCDDGEYFLREFQRVFPAREVLNNLGFCYLQRARQEMESERADFYWMPQVLDAETLAAPLVMGERPLKTLKQAAASRQGEGFLKDAQLHLEKAIEADFGYVPARINLAVTYLYLGKPHKARSVLEEAQALAPDNLEIQGLQALALYEQSEVDLDLWPRAIARLERLAYRQKVPSSVLYNLARLLEIRPRPLEARQYWNRLAYKADSLPAPIRTIVCNQQSAVRNCGRRSLSASRALHTRWDWPIPFEWQSLSAQPAVINKLYAWGRPISFNWYREKLRGHIYQHPDGHIEVLELEDFMQMQVLKGDNLESVHKLSNYCGQPLRQRTLAKGELWSCGNWAALALDGKVQEVWRILR